MGRLKIILIGGVFFAVMGCDSGIVVPDSGDELPSTGEYVGIQSRSYQKTGDKWHVVDLFDLDIDVDFNQISGEVTIQSTFRANLQVEKGRFALFAPELAQLHEKGQGAEISVQMGERLIPFASTSVTMGRGQTQRETSVLKLIEPGYYQVFVVVEDMDEENVFTEDGAFIDPKALKHFWIWYDGKDKDIEITSKFEYDRFPDSIDINAGPFVKKGDKQRLFYENVRNASMQSTTTQSNYDLNVVYTNPTTETVDPLVSAKVVSQIYDGFEDSIIYEASTSTNSNGEAFILCRDEWTSPSQEIRIFVRTENTDVNVVGTNESSNVVFISDPWCDDLPITRSALATLSHAFTWTNSSVDIGENVLERSRSRIKVVVDPNANNSFYSPSQDRIVLRESHTDGSPFGNFVIAHEYGHAFHRKALNVIVPGNCPSPHHFDGPHNLNCAYIEGFANYFGALTANNIFTTLISINSFYPGTVYHPEDGDPNDGSLIEGAVAAFLYDITDPANEPHDNVEYPGNYLSQVIESCQVREGSNWIQANGIDHIITCLEEQIPDYSNYFDTRLTIPNNFNVTSAKPSGWSQSDIESLWEHNLYGEN